MVAARQCSQTPHCPKRAKSKMKDQDDQDEEALSIGYVWKRPLWPTTMSKTSKRRRGEELNGERCKTNFIDLDFEIRQIVGFWKGRGK